MAGLFYSIFTSSTLISLGLYHLISTTMSNLKSPSSYIAKPTHPFSLSPTTSSQTQSRLKHLQLYLLIICLLISSVHQTLISSDTDPLLRGRTPVHRFTSLQSAAVLFLALLVSISLLVSESSSFFHFPSDIFFALASVVFFLQYSVSSSAASVQISDLQAKCDAVSARISALSSFLLLLLACNSRLFVADVLLGASVILQGLWALQTGLSLYVEAFIPEGCHKLLDVVNGVEGSTKCDLEESRLRAVAILDLVFVVHVMFVVIIVMVTYAVVAKTVGIRRFGSYETLPTTAVGDSNHVQMKAMSGVQA